jgi:pyruvate dehydrogenase E1 component
MRSFADQIRPFVRARYRVLGTDGFGRSDGREKLRHHFEVDRFYVCTAALWALSEDGTVESSRVVEAIRKYGIDPEKPNPATL